MSDLLRPPNFGQRPERASPQEPTVEDPLAQDAKLKKAMVALGFGTAFALLLCFVFFTPARLVFDPLGWIGSMILIFGIVGGIAFLLPRAQKGSRDRKWIVWGGILLLLALLVLSGLLAFLSMFDGPYFHP